MIFLNLLTILNKYPKSLHSHILFDSSNTGDIVNELLS